MVCLIVLSLDPTISGPDHNIYSKQSAMLLIEILAHTTV